MVHVPIHIVRSCVRFNGSTVNMFKPKSASIQRAFGTASYLSLRQYCKRHHTDKLNWFSSTNAKVHNCFRELIHGSGVWVSWAGLTRMKPLGAKWLTKLYDCERNPRSSGCGNGNIVDNGIGFIDWIVTVTFNLRKVSVTLILNPLVSLPISMM